MVGGRPWTEVEDQQVIELSLAGMVDADIALELGRGKRAVRQRRHNLRTEGRMRRKGRGFNWTMDDDMQLLELAKNEAYTMPQLGALLGRSSKSVEHRLKTLRAPPSATKATLICPALPTAAPSAWREEGGVLVRTIGE